MSGQRTSQQAGRGAGLAVGRKSSGAGTSWEASHLEVDRFVASPGGQPQREAKLAQHQLSWGAGQHFPQLRGRSSWVDRAVLGVVCPGGEGVGAGRAARVGSATRAAAPSLAL